MVVRVKNRDAVQKKMADKGISTGIHYPIPIHLQRAYAECGWSPGDFLEAEAQANDILSLPMFAELTEAQVEEVCEALRQAI
jgi:dTDP-4-amino-4,6-dideoxygalactose transaminase